MAYDAKNYKGGHLVPFSDFVAVRSYMQFRAYHFVIEFRDDSGCLYAVKFSSHRPSGWVLEQAAIDAAFDLLGTMYKKVS